MESISPTARYGWHCTGESPMARRQIELPAEFLSWVAGLRAGAAGRNSSEGYRSGDRLFRCAGYPRAVSPLCPAARSSKLPRSAGNVEGYLLGPVATRLPMEGG